MKKIVNLLLLLTIPLALALGQETLQPDKKKKIKMELRPNSREYGAVKYDNFQKRIDRKRDKVAFQKKKIAIQQRKLNLQKNKTQLRKAKMMQRKQTVIQRRRSVRK